MKKQSYMKIIFLVCMLAPFSALASTYLSIESADTKSEFPVISVSISPTSAGIKNGVSFTSDTISAYEDGFRSSFIRIEEMKEARDLLLVFALDSSKSMSPNNFSLLKANARTIITETITHARISLYRFNDSVVLLNNFSNDRQELFSTLESITQHGSNTLMYNAIFDAISHVASQETPVKQVVVYTDGHDEGSSISAEDIITFARKYNVHLHFITIRGASRLQSMRRLATLSGGSVVFAEDTKELNTLRNSLLNGNRRYRVSFRTLHNADGKDHEIEIRLKDGVIRDRAILKAVYPASLISFSINNEYYPYIFATLSALLILFILLFGVVLKKTGRKKKAAPSSKKQTQYGTVSYSDDEITPARNFSTHTLDDETVQKSDPGPSYTSAWIMEKAGPNTGNRYPLKWEETYIGSGNDNSIALPDRNISSHHAKIKRIGKAYYLYDLVSEEGTYLNAKKLLRPKPLHDWDEISLGNVSLIFRGSKLKV